MAVDPNTGQTILTPSFDQKYAGYLDPSIWGQIAGGQQQAGLQGQLAQEMLNRGYIPNSGFGGAIAQMVQAFTGMKLLKDSQSKIGELASQQVAAANVAEQKKHIQDQADLDAAKQRSIDVATGSKKGELQAAIDLAPQQTAADVAKAQAMVAPEAAKAGAISAAQLPSQAALEKMKGGYQLASAEIGANATKGRAYQVQDANGNTTMVALQPDGSFKPVYTATTPGGGKLSPADAALNTADTNNLEKMVQRGSAASQLKQNLINWTASYTGADPQTLQGLGAKELAAKVAAVPAATAIANINPLGNRGLDSIAQDIAINAAGTKQPTPTEEVLKAEQNNTVSRYKTPGENAAIVANHLHDIDQLQAQIDQSRSRITSRSTPGQGRIPASEPGPMNPTAQAAQQVAPGAQPTQTATNPKTGQKIGLVNGQWVPL